MSWDSFPVGFLKMKRTSWRKLDWSVRKVVVELAKNQNFKCALCPATRGLIIEHDHEPDEGTGHPYTQFNIRGLVCKRCNWHLMVYEKEKNGEYLGWDNADCWLSDIDYDSYDFTYRCRVRPLIEEVLERRLGSGNYWRRRICLEKFDAWYYDGERSEWRERWEQRRALKIETPEQFIEVMRALIKFYAEQKKRDPTFEPPNEFILLMRKLRDFIEQLFNSTQTSEVVQPQ